jgi:hypothetical protein
VPHTEPSRVVRISRDLPELAGRSVGEVATAMVKMVALHAGSHMGYWYATTLASGRHDLGLADMDKMLQSSI